MGPARPKGLLVDYGETLVRELAYDTKAGNEWLLARAHYLAPDTTIERVLERAARATNDLATRRDEFQVETPWPALTRLIHDFFGTRFQDSMDDLELGFWKASAKTAPMPGAADALEELHRCGIPIGVVSNCSFGSRVIEYELAQYGLAERLRFVMVSAEYGVRKPNALLFETAAAKLGRNPEEIWFVGDRLDVDMAGAKSAGMTAIWFHPEGGGAGGPADLAVTGWGDFLTRFRLAS